jgi:hypothetical protein
MNPDIPEFAPVLSVSTPELHQLTIATISGNTHDVYSESFKESLKCFDGLEVDEGAMLVVSGRSGVYLGSGKISLRLRADCIESICCTRIS